MRAGADGVDLRASALSRRRGPGARVDRHGLPRRPWVRKTGKAYPKSRLNSEFTGTWASTTTASLDGVGGPRGRGGDPRRRRLARVPSLEGMVYAPIVRGDGSILQIAGYDSATRADLSPGGGPRRDPRESARSHVDRARDALLDVICDF